MNDNQVVMGAMRQKIDEVATLGTRLDRDLFTDRQNDSIDSAAAALTACRMHLENADRAAEGYASTDHLVRHESGHK